GGAARLELPALPTDAEPHILPVATEPEEASLGREAGIVSEVLPFERSVRIGTADGRTRTMSETANRTTLADVGRSIGVGIVEEASIRPEDPLSARIEGKASYHLETDSGVVDSISRLQVSSTSEAFHVQVDLDVALNGTTFATRRWNETIPRDLC